MAGSTDANEKQNFAWLAKLGEYWASASLNLTRKGTAERLEETRKQIPGPDRDIWHKRLKDLVDQGYIDSDTAEMLKTITDEPWPVSVFMWVLAEFKIIMGNVDAIMNAYSLDRQYDVMNKTTPHPAPVDNLVRSMILDPDRASENRAMLKRHGFDDTQIDNIILSYYRTIDENTLRTLYLRGKIDEDRLYERMRELGYTDIRTAEVVQTWALLPSPQDLFTMVAHEAFEPDIYNKLGLAAEFPTEQVEWLKEQGISEAWAMKYWIAHWDQPSIGQGFEMLHRGVIDTEELDMLFKTVEIPQYWRERLTAIAYQPYTRVDVRRMHDMGILDDDALVRAYLDLGYDEEKAANMALFTIAYNTDNEKSLTRSAILESYHEDLISRSDARSLLTSQGYTGDLADYYLTLEEYKVTKEIQSLTLANIEDQFLLGVINEATAKVDLNRLGLRGSKIDALVQQWKLKQYSYQAIPSKSELDNFLVKGIIDVGAYRELMERHGFSPLHTSWYLEDLQNELEISRRLPTKAEVGAWYKKDIITKEEYYDYLTLMGYETFIIDNYFKAL